MRLGADPVDEHEGALRDDGGAGDEVGSEGRVGLDLERARENLGSRWPPETSHSEHVEARRLALRSRPDHERAAALRRLRLRRAVRSRDGEERDNDRREQCSGANHELTR